MSRFDSICQLVTRETVRDSRGVSRTVDTPRRVYCNVFSIGDSAYFEASNAGYHLQAELQLRKCDYSGERLVIFDGELLSVERVNMASPDFVRLTLVKELGEDG